MALRVAWRAWHHDALVMRRNICAWTERLDFWHQVCLSGFGYDTVGVRRVVQQASDPNVLAIGVNPSCLDRLNQVIS